MRPSADPQSGSDPGSATGQPQELAGGATPTRRAQRRQRLVLLAVSLLVSLLFAEAALRLTGLAASGRGSPWFAGGNHPRFLFQEDAAAGYTLRPGFKGVEIAPAGEFSVPVAIDGGGLRVQPHPAPASPRVLAIGDSMTFGEGVAADRTWSAELERGLGVRVDNGGVPGYASPQMRARLRQLLSQVRPQLVLVALSPHWDQQRCRDPFQYLGGYIVGAGYRDRLHLVDGNLYLEDVRWPMVGPATAWLKGHSHLARLLLPALRDAALRVTRGKPKGADANRPGPPGASAPSAAAIAAMHADATAAGAGFLVLFLDSRGPGYEADRDALAAELQRRGIPYLALDELLAGTDWEPLRYPRDRHWNEKGHRAVAMALVPRLRPLLAR